MSKLFVAIKDGVVVNTITIDDQETQLIETIKNENNYDSIIKCFNIYVVIGENVILDYNFNGLVFHSVSPFPSWLMDSETYLWDAPIPMPTDGAMYSWNEETINWITQLTESSN
jgi:hypothetical protein